LQELENLLREIEHSIQITHHIDWKFKEDVGIRLVQLGIYFGDIFRRELGGNWVFDPELGKEKETVDSTFLIVGKKLVDPFDVFFARIFKGQDWGVIDYFENMARQINPSFSLGQKLIVDLHWNCPACRARNIVKTKIALQLSVTCSSCHREFLYVSGEVILSHRLITKYFLSECYCDWTLRLQQIGDTKEIHFTLRSNEYIITEGDYIVAFIKQNKVIYLENKATNTYVYPE